MLLLGALPYAVVDTAAETSCVGMVTQRTVRDCALMMGALEDEWPRSMTIRSPVAVRSNALRR
jgi:Asp-tRNA(Asn)/Glu-tRNA(Gln) amidotransferase A subunit family amidase